MRHLRSLSYALVLAPAVWTLSAVAFTQDLTGRARDEQTIEAVTGFLLLLLAGAAYAILLLPRFSPAGPLTTGVLFLAVCVWVLIDPGSFDGLFPAAVRKPGFDLTLPAHGLGALLAVPLLCTALSRRRWRTARFDPADATTSTFIWPFARPARPGTLVVPGAPGVPPSDATQVLHLGEPAGRTQVLGQGEPAPGDRTQVIPGAIPVAADATRPEPPAADATQVLPPTAATTRPVSPPADATQVLPPAADATQVLPPTGDATQKLPPAADATQALPPMGDATQVLPPVDATQTLPPAAPDTPAPGPAPASAGTTTGGAATGAPEPDSAPTVTVGGPGGPLPAEADTEGDETVETASSREAEQRDPQPLTAAAAGDTTTPPDPRQGEQAAPRQGDQESR